MKYSIIEGVAREQRDFLLSTNNGLERKELFTLPDLSAYVLIISGIRWEMWFFIICSTKAKNFFISTKTTKNVILYGSKTVNARN